jgi:hypothetical protein
MEMSRALRFSLPALLLCAWFLAIPSFGASHHGISPDALPVFSDFDGDNKLDQAELISNGSQKSIHVSLGKFAWTSLSFDSGVSDRGHLVSDDFDRDGDADLVWISQSSPETIVLWLGDGRGNFSRANEHEAGRIEALLVRAEQPRITDDSSEDASPSVLQPTTEIALTPNSFVSLQILCERFSCASQLTIRPSALLSTLRDRAPPSRLS